MGKQPKKVKKDEFFYVSGGNFIGRNGQRFGITAEDLIGLHELPAKRCTIHGKGTFDKSKKYTLVKATHRDLVKLFPEYFADFIEAHPDDFPDLIKGADEKEEFHGFEDDS